MWVANRKSCASLLGVLLVGCSGWHADTVDVRVTDAPLYVAIRNGDLEEVRRALSEDPAAVHRRDGTFGETPLHQAATADQVEIARLLLESGAPVNAFDGRRLTPLTAALDAGASEEMIALIEEYGGVD